MSIVAIHSSVMYDDEDQGGSVGLPDNVAMQEISALGAGLAYNATTDKPTTFALATLANGVVGTAFAATVTGY